MMFKFYNKDGKFICEVIVNTMEELWNITRVYNKRSIVVDIKEITLRLVERD